MGWCYCTVIYLKRGGGDIFTPNVHFVRGIIGYFLPRSCIFLIFCIFCTMMLLSCSAHQMSSCFRVSYLFPRLGVQLQLSLSLFSPVSHVCLRADPATKTPNTHTSPQSGPYREIQTLEIEIECVAMYFIHLFIYIFYRYRSVTGMF